MTTEMNYMQWVGRNLDWFSFRTPQARQLRQDIRTWFYGDRDEAGARQLCKRFDRMFSNDVFQDICFPFLRREIARQFMIKDRQSHLASIAEPPIVGTTIRAYGGPEERWRQAAWLSGRLHQQAAQAAQRVRAAAQLLGKGALAERQWYEGRKVRLWTLVCLLWYAFGVASGLALLGQLVNELGFSVDFAGAMSRAFPHTFQRWGGWSYLVPGFALCMACLFFGQVRRLGYTLAGCLLWLKDIRRESVARSAFYHQFVQRLKEGAMDKLADELCACVRPLAARQTGFLEKEDASGPLLNKGVEGLAGLPLPKIRPQWEKREKFYRNLQKNSLKRPGFYLAAGVVLTLLVYGFMADPAGLLPVWRLVRGA